MNAVFRKELRDVLRWSPIGMLLLAALFWYASPRQVYDVQRIEATYISTVGIGCGLIAVALGLLQTMFDARADARGYLLHRPIATAKIFWAKLLAGFVGYLACLLPPLILTAIYLQYKGIERLPTSWQQLTPLMIAALILFALHPTAVWMAHRNARWFGTRALPLVLGIAGVWGACMMVLESNSVVIWLVLIAVSVSLYLVVIFAARHAFIHQSSSPPASSVESMSWSRAIGLFLASTIATTTVLVVAYSLLPRDQTPQPTTVYRLAFSSDGQPWEIGETFKYPRRIVKDISKRVGRPLTADQSQVFAPLPESWQESPRYEFGYLGQGSKWAKPFRSVGGINTSDTRYDYLLLYEHDGLLLVYEQSFGLAAIVTPRGIFAPDAIPEGRFQNVLGLANTILPKENVWVNLAGAPILVDSGGVYQLDFESREVHRLIDRPTTRVAIALPTEGRDGVLYAIHDDQLAAYTMRSHDSEVKLTNGDDGVVAKTNNYLLPSIDLEPSRQWKLDISATDTLGSVAQVDEGVTAVVYHHNRETRYQIFEADGTRQQDTEFTPTAVSQRPSEMLEALVAPPVVIIAAVGITYAFDLGPSGNTSQLWLPFAGLMIIGVVAGALAFWLCNRRGLSRRARIVWVVIAGLTGISALLAIVATYPRAVRASCPSCDALRRVDQDQCGHCGADWEPPEQEGIEIFSVTSPVKSDVLSDSLP